MNKNSTNLILPKYDTAFIDPGIGKVIEAIEAQKSGQKILLVFRNSLNYSDSFQITETFPDNLFELFKSAGKSRMYKKLFLLCPHLIQAQKVIYLKTGSIKTRAKTIDLFFKNQLNEKSIIINKNIPENLSFLKIKKLQGIIFQEYKINTSRLFIEILKFFEKSGGKIQVGKSFNDAEISNIIECKTEKRISFLANINTPSNFVLSAKNKKHRFRLFENKNQLQIDFDGSKTKKITKTELLTELEKFVSLKSESTKTIENSSFLSTKTVSNIVQTINTALPCSFTNAQIKDNYELSLEKFDIAKQTGITYPEFKMLFHRYGKGIDEMIDEAYEKMNETRDPKKIWDQVEDWFQKKNEWKVSEKKLTC